MTGEELKTRFTTNQLKKGSSDVLHPGGGRKEETVPEKPEKAEKRRRVTKAQSTDGQEEPQETGGYFRVDDIVDHRECGGKMEYLVKWHGYEHDENTWEEASAFADTKAIKDYWAKRRKQKEVVTEERRSTRPRKKKRV